jgi:hypothetical protein
MGNRPMDPNGETDRDFSGAPGKSKEIMFRFIRTGFFRAITRCGMQWKSVDDRMMKFTELFFFNYSCLYCK